MLLTVDLGNTSIKLGLFDEGEEIFFGIYPSEQNDYRALVLSMLFKKGLREEVITDAIISSVVPHLYKRVLEAVRSFVKQEHIIDINPFDDYGIRFDTPNNQDIGDDLVVMSAYAYHLFHRELIVVSLGTASVINHISEDGVFRHCIIAPGFHKLADTLWGNAALLPKFDPEMKDSFLANTTEGAMNVGIYKGYVGMLEYLINGMKDELGIDPYIVACGGLGKEVEPFTDIFDYYEADFVTKGLAYIYERNYND